MLIQSIDDTFEGESMIFGSWIDLSGLFEGEGWHAGLEWVCRGDGRHGWVGTVRPDPPGGGRYFEMHIGPVRAVGRVGTGGTTGGCTWWEHFEMGHASAVHSVPELFR